MKIERTKNTVRSIAFGFIYKIINIVLPFFSRTAILYVLGAKYLGLSSLFSSILSFLSLAELGVGGAMVFSMYKPIAENDNATICALLNLYRKYYRVIGLVIFGIGMLLMPFLPRLIHDSIPSDINLYVLYLIYLINTCLSYWLFAYKNSVIQAYQRYDVNSKIGSILAPVSYVFMLGALFITKNYYAYVIWLPIFTIIENVAKLIYVNRHYPRLKPEGNISPALKASITKKVKALIGTKLNTVVLNAADNIVMAAFLGLTAITMYGNYYYIMSSVVGFLSICYASMTAGLGNCIATETVEKNYGDFMRFSFMNAWLVGWCAICLLCLYQPFMHIWVGEELMFSFPIVIEFVIYFYIYQLRKIPVVYKDAAGIWWEDRFRPYVCMVVNLVLNIILVQVIGVSGIILSTVFSLAISIPWENYTIFKYVFGKNSKEYYKKMFCYMLTTIISGGVCFWVCGLLGDGISLFVVKMVICLIVPNVVFAGLNCRRPEFGETLQMLGRILKRKI